MLKHYYNYLCAIYISVSVVSEVLCTRNVDVLTFAGSRGSCLNSRPTAQTSPEGPGKC